MWLLAVSGLVSRLLLEKVQRFVALLTSCRGCVFSDLRSSVPLQRSLVTEALLCTHVDVQGGTLCSGASFLK